MYNVHRLRNRKYPIIPPMSFLCTKGKRPWLEREAYTANRVVLNQSFSNNPSIRPKAKRLIIEYFCKRSSCPQGKSFTASRQIECQTTISNFKIWKMAVSFTPIIHQGSFLSIPKKEQFWKASRLLAIRRFKPLRLSLKIKSWLWYFVDGVSKSSGPKESGCNIIQTKYELELCSNKT